MDLTRRALSAGSLATLWAALFAGSGGFANAAQAAEADAILAHVDPELRAIAGHLFKDQPRDHTLQPTALVNEVCVRMLKSDQASWNDRKHFIRAAAKAMRNLLSNHARDKQADKRGGMTVTLGGLGGERGRDTPAPLGSGQPLDLIVLDETITRLTEVDPRLGQVFELRYLAGLPVEQVADLLGVSERTVMLDAQFIRAWVQREMKQ